MKVTRIKVSLKENKGDGIVAEALIVLNDCLMVHAITIKKINDSYFVCMPENKKNSGIKRVVKGKTVPWDVVHPTTKAFSDYLTGVILQEYHKEVALRG